MRSKNYAFRKVKTTNKLGQREYIFMDYSVITVCILRTLRLQYLGLQIDMIYLVLKVLPEDSRESQTARVLLYKLFYDQTEQGLTQFLLNLFRSFDSHKQPKRLVHSSVICIH